MSALAYLITNGYQDEVAFWSTLARALEVGVDLVQIREKSLTTRALERCVNKVRALVGERGGGRACLLVNDRVDVAIAAAADGVHLPAAGLPVEAVRAITPDGFLVGVSTHSPEEARAAARGGADFIVLGPVFETPSKPGARPIGVGALAEAVGAVHIPVLALGGITPERVGEVLATGASGIAGISAFRSADVLKSLMAVLREAGGPGTSEAWRREMPRRKRRSSPRTRGGAPRHG